MSQWQRTLVRGTTLLAAAGAAMLTAGVTSAAAAPGHAASDPAAAAAQAGPPPAPAYPVIATGLDNPRLLTFGSDGSIYVAEAGHGGDGACIKSDDDPTVDTCFGASGAIAKIAADGSVTQAVTGLPSLAPQVATQGGQLPPGSEATGPSDVAVLPNGDLAFTVGLGSDPANRATFSDVTPSGARFGTLATATPPTTADDATEIADIAQFEADHNPVPPADAPDSNPTGLLRDGDGFLVTDSGGNDLLRVDADGNVSIVTTFDTTGKTCPPPPIDPQSVPTSVVKGPDGAYYVSELTGFPFCQGGSTIWRVKNGEASAYASDLTNVTDLAFGPDGTLYAVEIAQRGLQQGPFGAVVAIPPAGGTHFSDYRVIAGGLFAPYGIALHHGFAYVTTGSIMPAATHQGSVVAIPLGCDFPDVAGDSVFRPAICSLAGADVVSGYPDGTFRPARAMSRQGFAAVLGRIQGVSGQCAAGSSPFADVADTSPFCEPIRRLAAAGVINGYPDGTFRPADPVSRQAAAAFLWRDYEWIHTSEAASGDAPRGATSFSDVPASNRFSGDIAFGSGHGLINGYPDGTFRPAAPASRQAAAAFAYRLGQLAAGPAFPTAGTLPWTSS